MFTERVALHRLSQQIAWQGKRYTFYRRQVNEFNEQSTEPAKLSDIKGLFHNGSSNHVVVNTTDNGQVIEKNTPYIMTTWGQGKMLQLNDEVTINEKTYRVTAVANINEYSLIAEVSLEVILDGVEV